MPVLDELCENCDRPATHLEGGIPLCDSSNCRSTKQSRFDEKKFSDFEEEIIPPAPIVHVDPPKVVLTAELLDRRMKEHSKQTGRTFTKCAGCGERYEIGSNGSSRKVLQPRLLRREEGYAR